MNQLPVLAYKYHETLESFRTFRGVRTRLLVGATLAALGFVSLLGRLVLTTAQRHGHVQWLEIVMTFVGEILFLLFVFAVREARDKEAVLCVNALVRSETPAATIRQARSALLAYLFNQPCTAFLSIADSIRKCLDLANAADPKFSFRAEDLLNFVFNPEARTRIVSLSLALATLITGLTLLSGEARETALQIVVELRPQWFGLWLTGVVVLAGLYFGLAVFFSCGRALCEYISRRSSDEKEMNPALVRYLLCDLATYHVWPGPTLTSQPPPLATEEIPTTDAGAQAPKLVSPATPESTLPA